MFLSPLPMFSLPTDEPRLSAAVRSGPFRWFGWVFVCLWYITSVLPTRHASAHGHKPAPSQSAHIGLAMFPRMHICPSGFHQLLHGISGLIPVCFSFSLLSDHLSGLSSFPLLLVDATVNFKTNNGHGEASSNTELARVPDSSTYPAALTLSLSSVFPLFPLTHKVSVSLPATRFGHGGRRHLAHMGCNWGSTCSIGHLTLVPPPPRNQKRFPNPKHPREWGLVEKLLMHQDKYVYSVFDALSLGETNCTLERAMER